jgi:phospholipid/cholesterol/gamma-HCH transport system permease protein
MAGRATVPQPIAPPKARPARPAGIVPPAVIAALAGFGGVLALTVRSARCWVTPPFAWWREAVEQAWILVKRCMIPAGVSVLAFGYGAVGTQGGIFLSLLGQIDRLGQFYGAAALREYVPWVTGMVVAGVAGTAICADLGARKVRDELDALAVIGVDTVRTLVAPRILALMMLTPLLNLIGLLFAAASGAAAELVHHGTTAGFIASFNASFTVVDVLANIVKALAFGLIIGAVCCYKGLNASGGSEGVGRAVNQAVVTAFVAVWIFNFAFNAVYLASFPAALAIR